MPFHLLRQLNADLGSKVPLSVRKIRLEIDVRSIRAPPRFASATPSYPCKTRPSLNLWSISRRPRHSASFLLRVEEVIEESNCCCKCSRQNREDRHPTDQPGAHNSTQALPFYEFTP